ncbi:MAG: response regulator [Anaerolineae bacterium]|nr:response regulator [Anaerolineae bacterium]MDW8071416.1 response regulator [Anaerolineae bacterium]
MRVKFWGTRGSIPSPGLRTLRYGGNTICVELRTDTGQRLILDGGTGLRELGRTLVQEADALDLNILISHTHWDHTQGLPFFAPMNRPENRIIIYATSGTDKDVMEIFTQQMDYANFPVSLEERPGQIAFREIGEEEFTIGDIRVQSCFVNHTILTLGYRISHGNVCIVYVTDHEPFAPSLYHSNRVCPDLDDIVHAGDRRHVRFLAGADLVIHDAQFTAAELERRRGWGHSSLEYAVEVCVAAGVKQLAFIHHDPDRSDEELERLEAAGQAYARQLGSELKVFAAAEGSEIELPETGIALATPVLAQTPSLDTRVHARILVVDDEPAMMQYLSMVLMRDGYEVLQASNGYEALTLVRERSPDLVLLDVMMPEMDGFQVLRELRASEEFQELPVIILTALTAEQDIVRGFEGGVTDYIDKPVTPAVLRARVRRWLVSRENR